MILTKRMHVFNTMWRTQPISCTDISDSQLQWSKNDKFIFTICLRINSAELVYVFKWKSKGKMLSVHYNWIKKCNQLYKIFHFQTENQDEWIVIFVWTFPVMNYAPVQQSVLSEVGRSEGNHLRHVYMLWSHHQSTVLDSSNDFCI